MNVPPIIYVNPHELRHLPTKNPNVMDKDIMRSLVEVIRRDGFLQPVLVVDEDGYVIVDGVHRTAAAIELGLEEIPAVVAPDRKRAEILRIALNKHRGELNISEVSHQLQLLLDTGFDREELQLTGFQEWEIETMLDGMDLDEDDDLKGANVAPIEPEKPKTYALNFKFTTESERARIKEALEEAGDGNALAGLQWLVDHFRDE